MNPERLPNADRETSAKLNPERLPNADHETSAKLNRANPNCVKFL
jgi:hypothetical protein